MDGLVSSILACDEFLAASGTGTHINAQSLSKAQRCEWLRVVVSLLVLQYKGIPLQDPWQGMQSQSMPCAIPFPNGQSYLRYPCQ